MATIRYELASFGLQMTVDGVPIYFFGRDASVGILWARSEDGHLSLLAHGRPGMVLERQKAHQNEVPLHRAFVTVDQIDPRWILTMNAVLAGGLNASAIVQLMQVRQTARNAPAVNAPLALAA